MSEVTTPNPEQAPVLLRVEQVAKLLQLCPARIYQMIASGELPHIRDRRSIRVPVEEISKWIRKKRREAGC